MLRFLSIRQLAVIDSLEVELAPGLNVLTGETGAGKSIIVSALDLLLGGRAASDLVRTGADAAQVQAVLDGPNGEELIVRREVSSSGRSRAFVQGDLVTSAQLRDATGPLVDLHGQHEHQALLAPQHHLELLDRFAGLDAERARAGEAYAEFVRVRRALEACQLDDRERTARLDLLTFQLGEIDKVAPRAGEDDDLGAERQRLASADRIQRLAGEAYQLLYESDAAVIGSLAQVWKRVGELADLDPRLATYLDARDPIRSQLEDLASTLRACTSGFEDAPERLQQVEDRLALLERVKRRHGPTLAEVLARRAALRDEIEALATTAERAAGLEGEVAAARARFLAHAGELSARRRETAPELGLALCRELDGLALPHVTFEVRFQETVPEPQWGPTGVDVVEFFFSANPGESLRPLARIASGGELSRVMLALKTLATTDVTGKTLVFDEVDAGIGGRVADAVGERLRGLGTRFQVLCITHLPQVAAHGHAHYQVAKDTVARRTVTTIRRLDDRERVAELARMIGGTAVTAAVVAGAEEMLAARAKVNTQRKAKAKVASSRGEGG